MTRQEFNKIKIGATVSVNDSSELNQEGTTGTVYCVIKDSSFDNCEIHVHDGNGKDITEWNPQCFDIVSN